MRLLGESKSVRIGILSSGGLDFHLLRNGSFPGGDSGHNLRQGLCKGEEGGRGRGREGEGGGGDNPIRSSSGAWLGTGAVEQADWIGGSSLFLAYE